MRPRLPLQGERAAVADLGPRRHRACSSQGDRGTDSVLSCRFATVFVAVAGLSLAGPRAAGAARCPSTCTRQLAECKRACPAGGRARRACREACGERSSCTAPGARIRTLAYVLTECDEDIAHNIYAARRQRLVIRRGNCDPVTVME